MLLKNRDTNWAKRFFLGLYGAVSYFGECVWLPLVWLAVLYVASVYFYWSSSQGLSEAFRSAFLGFVTLKIKTYAGPGGWLIPSLQRILGIPIITLFILALRRAFRR
jgi:hypothetical protein